MTSYPRRDPVTDRLLTPENSALICYRLNLTIYMGEYE